MKRIEILMVMAGMKKTNFNTEWKTMKKTNIELL